MKLYIYTVTALKNTDFQLKYRAFSGWCIRENRAEANKAAKEMAEERLDSSWEIDIVVNVVQKDFIAAIVRDVAEIK